MSISFNACKISINACTLTECYRFIYLHCFTYYCYYYFFLLLPQIHLLSHSVFPMCVWPHSHHSAGTNRNTIYSMWPKAKWRRKNTETQPKTSSYIYRIFIIIYLHFDWMECLWVCAFEWYLKWCTLYTFLCALVQFIFGMTNNNNRLKLCMFNSMAINFPITFAICIYM